MIAYSWEPMEIFDCSTFEAFIAVRVSLDGLNRLRARVEIRGVPSICSPDSRLSSKLNRIHPKFARTGRGSCL